MLFTTFPLAATVTSALTVFAAAHSTDRHHNSTHHNPLHNNSTSHITYSTVPDYFLQDSPSTNASTFDFKTTNFGLINRTYPTDEHYDPESKKTQWQRFTEQVHQLNKDAPKNTHYKLLFMGRHGDGFHNDAQAYYGTPAWNCYYSIRDGNSTITWSDAHLSPLGISQALSVKAFWAKELKEQKIPAPQSYYTSPLTRCLQTADLTFNGLDLPAKHPFVPTVKELFREGISGHTCDRRGSKTYIHNAFPSYRFEKGFSEEDHLWEALHGETNPDQDVRSKIVLDEVFGSDGSTFISITSHSGEISSLLRVLGHRVFGLSTGATIPVLVKAETQKGAAPPATLERFEPICTCTAAPPPTATTSVCSTPTGTGGIPSYPSEAAWRDE